MARVKQQRNLVGNRLQVEINKLDQARTAAEIARLENEAAGLWGEGAANEEWNGSGASGHDDGDGGDGGDDGEEDDETVRE